MYSHIKQYILLLQFLYENFQRQGHLYPIDTPHGNQDQLAITSSHPPAWPSDVGSPQDGAEQPVRLLGTSLSSLLLRFPCSPKLGCGAGEGECEHIILVLLLSQSSFSTQLASFHHPLGRTMDRLSGLISHLLPCGSRCWSFAVIVSTGFFSSPQENSVSWLLWAGTAVH